MTAIGFTMFWVGSFVALFLHEPDFPIAGQRDRFVVAALIALAGLVSTLTGISIWFWGAMP